MSSRFIPIVVFAVVAVFLFIGVVFLKPKEIPSALINKPVPEFTTEAVPGFGPSFSSQSLKEDGVVLVNVFASWCVACREEHHVLNELSKMKVVPIYGLDYKDKPADGAKWLREWGNPYDRTGLDLKGRIGIDWGVYGVPETFVVKDGIIRHKHIGPLTLKDVKEKIVPMVQELRSE